MNECCGIVLAELRGAGVATPPDAELVTLLASGRVRCPICGTPYRSDEAPR